MTREYSPASMLRVGDGIARYGDRLVIEILTTHTPTTLPTGHPGPMRTTLTVTLARRDGRGRVVRRWSPDTPIAIEKASQ